MADDIQNQLRQAIAAARSGDRATAMRLLQRVIEQDNRNETAWMWMASIATSTADKRRYLQRVLSINPANQTARTALERLGGSASGASSANVDGTDRRNLVTIAIYAVGFLVMVLVTIVVIRGISDATRPSDEELTQVAIAAATQFAASQVPTETPNVTERPSRTPTLVGVLVTPQPATLPPTFTPTPEPTATDTPIPSPTPPPLSSYTIFYSSLASGAESPVLASIDGNGGEQTQYEITGNQAAISPDGIRVAFVAPALQVDDAPPTDTPTPPPTATPANPAATEEVIATEDAQDVAPVQQATDTEAEQVAVFVAPLNNLSDAEQLTTARTTSITGLSWSPDGAQVLYVRDDLFIEGVGLDGGVTVYLDDEVEALRGDPVFSPDGERIVYASDRETPGLLELYALDVASETVERLTDDTGISVAPAFSPDGTQIVFISDRNSDADVFIMEADGGNQRLLTQDDDGAVDRDPSFSPDGRLVAFSSTRGGTNFQIFVVNVQNLSIERVTDNNANNQNPSFRP